MLRVSIEGSIGAGKTTVMQIILDALKAHGIETKPNLSNEDDSDPRSNLDFRRASMVMRSQVAPVEVRMIALKTGVYDHE